MGAVALAEAPGYQGDGDKIPKFHSSQLPLLGCHGPAERWHLWLVNTPTAQGTGVFRRIQQERTTRGQGHWAPARTSPGQRLESLNGVPKCCPWGISWDRRLGSQSGMLVERNSSEIWDPHPYLYPSASPFLPPVWVRPLSPSQIPQGEPLRFPGVSVGKNQLPTLRPSALLPAPPWTWFGESSCSQESPRHADIREPNPQERGRELQTVPSQRRPSQPRKLPFRAF